MSRFEKMFKAMVEKLGFVENAVNQFSRDSRFKCPIRVVLKPKDGPKMECFFVRDKADFSDICNILGGKLVAGGVDRETGEFHCQMFIDADPRTIVSIFAGHLQRAL